MNIRVMLLAAVSATALGIADAQAADKTVPDAQALKSVDKNIAKDTDSDNRGLEKAKTRLESNETRHELHRDDVKQDRLEKAGRVERAERVERVERIERPERPGRP